LPILQQLASRPQAENRKIQALLLVPTRELAIQVNEVVNSLSTYLPRTIKSIAVYGGVSINLQMKNMIHVELLVATPGRLIDLVDNKAMSLQEVKVLVLDEADKMLNLGFKEEMKHIFTLLPAKRQNLLFSATLGKQVKDITEMVLTNPVKITIDAAAELVDIIQQTAYYVTEERKGPMLRYLIKEKNIQQALVFTSSIHRADAVVEKLKKHGIKAAALHGQKSQGARTSALSQFKNGSIQILVATDLASRGIDIQFLPYVINYELPRSPKDYIHRIGRTGRAENPGEAISLIGVEEQHHFTIIQKKMGKQVPTHETENINLTGL